MNVNKGKVSNILDGGKAVAITPYSGGTVTPALTVPFFLIGVLPVNTPVAYVLFEDGTGLILARMDGQGNCMGVAAFEQEIDTIIATEEQYIGGEA